MKPPRETRQDADFTLHLIQMFPLGARRERRNDKAVYSFEFSVFSKGKLLCAEN
jgi:hypothetical protein